MKEEFLLKQLVACALLSKKGQNLGDEDDEANEDSEDPDEEHPLGNSNIQSSSRRNRQESFKSENFSDQSPP